MLRSRIEPSPKGPNRRVYTLTDEGRAELLRWLHSGPAVGTERFAYLAQLYFMDAVGDLHETRAFMTALRDHLSRWLAQLRAVERDVIRHLRRCPGALRRRWVPPVRGAPDGHSFHRVEGDLVRRDAGRDRAAARVRVPRRDRRGCRAQRARRSGGSSTMTIVALLFDALVWAHVATGFVGLAAFWIPVFARKGGRAHVQPVASMPTAPTSSRCRRSPRRPAGSSPSRSRASALRSGPTCMVSPCFSATSGW